MAEPPEDQAAERIDRIVGDLLRGRSPTIGPGDAEHRETILAAAMLAGAREGYPRMTPGFRQKLAKVVRRQDPEPRWLNRRSALAGGVGLALGAAAGAVAARLGIATGAPARRTIQPRAQLARWADTGLTLQDLREGVPRRVQAGSVPAYLVLQEEGKLTAMSAMCTHLPCELAWRAQSRDLVCPCHGLAFNLKGVAQKPTHPLPDLPLVKVRVVGNGRIEVLGT